MTGELFINDKDAWSTWNVKLADNSYENLLSPYPMKSYIENESRSQDGKQVFITNPRKNSRQIILIFDITCSSRSEYLTKYKDFKNEISNGQIKLAVTSIDEKYYLYMEDPQSLDMGIGFTDGKVAIRFTEPLGETITYDVLVTENDEALLTDNNETIIV